MEAEQVVEKILSDAKTEAEKIQNQAQEKEAAEQARYDEQLDGYRKQTEILSQKAAENKKLHLLAAARMRNARDLLAEKRKILDEVFTQARGQLLNLPDDQYRQLITNLMLKAVETGDEEVIIDKNEKRIDQQLINQVNEQLPSGSKGNLTLSEERKDLGGGFILKHDKIKNNASLEVLLAQARRELEIELAKELFEK
jgi:V/A-type H+-transporting ATPase subunit E